MEDIEYIDIKTVIINVEMMQTKRLSLTKFAPLSCSDGIGIANSYLPQPITPSKATTPK